MFLFTATISNSQLEWAISLPGWSHAGQPFGPPGKERRKIYFYAKNRREATAQINRTPLVIRDLSEGKRVKKGDPRAE